MKKLNIFKYLKAKRAAKTVSSMSSPVKIAWTKTDSLALHSFMYNSTAGIKLRTMVEDAIIEESFKETSADFRMGMVALYNYIDGQMQAARSDKSIGAPLTAPPLNAALTGNIAARMAEKEMDMIQHAPY